MKNKFKYIVIPCIFVISVIFLAAYGTKITFGEAWFKDSLSNGIVPNKSIRMQPGDTLYYNGVPVTSGTGGGGIAASDNISFSGRVTTSDLWTFNDSAKFTRIVNMDSLKVSGNITSGDNKGLAWANTSSVKSVSGALYYSGGSHSFNTPYNNNVGTLDSINGLALAYGNFIPASGNGLFWDATHKITYSSPTMTMRGNYWTFKTAVNNSTLLQLDSVIGMQLYSGVYIGNGSGLTSVDAITIKGQDTTHFARTDTLTTEGIKGIWGFWNTVRFYTTATFDVSPIFSAVVNFANGLTTTTITASSTATFNGDVVNTGKRYQGASSNIDKYYRDTVIRAVCGATGTTVTTAHGISNTSNISMFTYQIKDDSSGLVLTPNATNAALVGAGLIYYPPYIDATNINLRIASSMVNLDNNTDTIKYFLRVTDYNR